MSVIISCDEIDIIFVLIQPHIYFPFIQARHHWDLGVVHHSPTSRVCPGYVIELISVSTIAACTSVLKIPLAAAWDFGRVVLEEIFSLSLGVNRLINM